MVSLAGVSDLLDGVAVRTPMEHSRWLSNVVGAPVWLKCENLQRTGSFKIRGAYVRLSRLSPEARARGVVAASAGNHAQGVALAAQMLGIEATVFMPAGASLPKVRATRAYGADVRAAGTNLAGALDAAREFAEETGAEFIHPYDHADVVAGQATCGLEILEQVPDVATIIVPTGGGGLLAGIAAAVAETEIEVIGAQAAQMAAWSASLAGGGPVEVAVQSTMADGIAVARPGDVPFSVAVGRVSRVAEVSEEALSEAMLSLLERAKLVAEPAGAAGVAALLEHQDLVAGGPVVVVISGGNVDPLLLGRIVQHGMAASGRYLTLEAEIEDHPGALARWLEELADLRVNVLEVEHERTLSNLGIGQVAVRLQVETRGPDHTEEVLAALSRRKGPRR